MFGDSSDDDEDIEEEVPTQESSSPLSFEVYLLPVQLMPIQDQENLLTDPVTFEWFKEPVYIGGGLCEALTIQELRNRAIVEHKKCYMHPLTREIISVVDIPKAAHLALQVIAQARKAVLASSQEVETTAQPRTWNQGTISSGDTPPGWENSISHGKCKKWIEDNIQSWFHHANQGILSR